MKTYHFWRGEPSQWNRQWFLPSNDSGWTMVGSPTVILSHPICLTADLKIGRATDFMNQGSTIILTVLGMLCSTLGQEMVPWSRFQVQTDRRPGQQSEGLCPIFTPTGARTFEHHIACFKRPENVASEKDRQTDASRMRRVLQFGAASSEPSCNCSGDADAKRR